MNPFSALHGLGRAVFILIVLAVILAFFVGRANAEPLALIHSSCAPDLARMSCTVGKLDFPKPDDLVAPCATTAGCWPTDGSAPLPVKKFKDMQAAEFIDGCDNPAVTRGTLLPAVWSNEADPCKGWRIWPVSTFATAVDLSTFTASSLGGVAPLSTTLTWDVTAVDACAASGSWSGSKPTKGSQTITGLTANAKYMLTCNSGQVLIGKAALSWTAPTQNIDNSALTNLAGYRIVYGTAADALTGIIELSNPAAVAYAVDGLTAGQTWFFAVRAYTSGNAESANSAVAQKTIAAMPGKTWTKTIDVAVTPAPVTPKPPTGLTVSQPTAYRLDQQPNKPVLVAVGSVPLGTPCTDERILDKNRVDNATVKLDRNRSRPNVALAACVAAL